MSRTGKIRVFFGDAEHDFCLRIGELIELEEKTGDGVGLLYAKMQPAAGLPMGQIPVVATREVLRLGLIGGGDVGKMEAARLVERHCVPPDLGEYAKLAMVVLGVAIVGMPEEEAVAAAPGEPTGDGDPSPFPTAEPAGPAISTPPARSASRSRTSSPRRSGPLANSATAGVRPTA